MDIHKLNLQITKTSIIILCTICIIVSSQHPVSSDPLLPTIRIDPITITTDTSEYTLVTITGVSNLAVLSLNINWDPTVITLEEVNTSFPYSDFDSVFYKIHQTEGILEIDAYWFDNTTELSGDINVLQLHIDGVDPVEDGISIMTITDSRLYDPDQQPISHDTQPMTIILENTNGGNSGSGSGGGGSSGGGSSGGGGAPPVENSDPVAVIAVSALVEMVDVAIEFDASESSDADGDSLSYIWDFSDGSTSTLELVSYRYANPGEYTVTLTVEDSLGGSDTATEFVTIQPQGNNPPSTPVITGSANGSVGVKTNVSIISTDLDNDTVKYAVDWGDNSSNITDFISSSVSVNLSHIWMDAGMYTIRVVATDENQASSPATLLIMLVDAVEINDIGYLVDSDGDDSYDEFIDGDGDGGIVEIGEDGWYEIDVEGDGIIDYRYDLEMDTLKTQTKGENDTNNAISNNSPLTIVGIVVIIILVLILLGLLYQRRRH